MKRTRGSGIWIRRLLFSISALTFILLSLGTGAWAAQAGTKGNARDASAAEGDRPTAGGNSAIRFSLFDYAEGDRFNINMKKPVDAWMWKPVYHWRDNAPIFQFMGTTGAFPGTESMYEQMGFGVNHATVERKLENGYPVLDLTRNARGEARTQFGADAQAFPREIRSLSYLFGADNHYGRVTAYTAQNTLLQADEAGGYYYDSSRNAVDYDTEKDLFRVRDYTERSSETAAQCDGSDCFDFLPFTYTGGQIIDSNTDTGLQYNVSTRNTNHWFGMTMEVDFFMPKDGKLQGKDMVFTFSGDDDVWVFVDDVLVLDLGGIHGRVDGSVNFATGEILQYLSQNGANRSEHEQLFGSDTSFPTTLRSCFCRADALPNGGWDRQKTGIFSDYTHHTLKLFYLKRGPGSAKCRMYFNLPTAEEDVLIVGKDLSVTETAAAELDGTEPDGGSFFRVWKANADGTPGDELLIPAGTDYTVLTGAQPEGESRTVGEDGLFPLKGGQRVQFDHFSSLAGYADGCIIEELIPSDEAEYWGRISHHINGSDMGCARQGSSGVNGYDSYFSYVVPIGQEQRFNMVMFTNVLDSQQLDAWKVFNEGYDFGCSIPVTVKLQGNPAGNPVKISFTLADDAGTRIPGVDITLTNDQTARKTLVLGFHEEMEPGAYTYTIQQEIGADDKILWDRAVYQATIVVRGGGQKAACLTGITKNGKAAEAVDFVNFIQIPLTLKYLETGSSGDTDGDFSLVVTAQVDGVEYVSYELELAHDQSKTLEGIPYGAVVTITQMNPENRELDISANGTTVTTVLGKMGAQVVTKPLITAAEVVFSSPLPEPTHSGAILHSLPAVVIFAGTLLLLQKRHRR